MSRMFLSVALCFCVRLSTGAEVAEDVSGLIQTKLSPDMDTNPHAEGLMRADIRQIADYLYVEQKADIVLDAIVHVIEGHYNNTKDKVAVMEKDLPNLAALVQQHSQDPHPTKLAPDAVMLFTSLVGKMIGDISDSESIFREVIASVTKGIHPILKTEEFKSLLNDRNADYGTPFMKGINQYVLGKPSNEHWINSVEHLLEQLDIFKGNMSSLSVLRYTNGILEDKLDDTDERDCPQIAKEALIVVRAENQGKLGASLEKLRNSCQMLKDNTISMIGGIFEALKTIKIRAADADEEEERM